MGRRQTDGVKRNIWISLTRNMCSKYSNIFVNELIDIIKTLMNNSTEPQHPQYKEHVINLCQALSQQSYFTDEVRHYVQQQGFTVEAHTSAIFFL
jgi:hypothetical protein